MGIILQTIDILISLLFLDSEQAKDKVREMKDRVGDKLKPLKIALSILIWATLLFPALFILIILVGNKGLIDVIGAVTALLITALFLFASPIEMLSKGLLGSGTAISADYFRNVLAVELCVILSAWIIPVYSPSTLLPVIAGALLIGLIAAFLFSRKIIAVPIAVTCLFLIRCYLVPGSCPTISYWILTLKDSLSEQYPALIAVLIVGLLFALFFSMKAIGIALAIMSVFLVYCYIFPEHIPVVGDKVKKVESDLSKRLETNSLSNKSFVIISTPAGADVYIDRQYKGKTPNVEITEQDLKTTIILKMPSYKQINVKSSDIRDNKILIRLERDPAKTTH